MVIYDLICDSGHQFEGWFKNADDLRSQQTTGLLTCPFCDSVKVDKKITAAKVGKKSNSMPSVDVSSTQSMIAGGGDSSPKAYAKLQRMLKEVHAFVENNFEDVGNRFADEAISIHKGDKDPANIRGTATAEQLKELAEEGISAVPLPPKPTDKKKLN